MSLVGERIQIFVFKDKLMQNLISRVRKINRIRLHRRRSKRFKPSKAAPGFMLACYGRPTILTDEWEPGTRKIVTELMSNIKLFVNVGANVGYYLCLAGKAEVKTIAFEPEMTNFQFLCNNVKINGFEDDVEVFPVAAGDPPPNLMKIHGVGDTASLSEEFQSVRRNVNKRRNGLHYVDSLGGVFTRY